MRRLRTLAAVGAVLAVVLTPVAGHAAATQDEIVTKCQGLFGSVFGEPNGEPLAACQ